MTGLLRTVEKIVRDIGSEGGQDLVVRLHPLQFEEFADELQDAQRMERTRPYPFYGVSLNTAHGNAYVTRDTWVERDEIDVYVHLATVSVLGKKDATGGKA